MLSVKFESPIIIDEKNLGALLTLAGVAAKVEPYVEGVKPGRKPRAAATPLPDAEPQASTSEPAPVKEPGKKRGRKSNAEKEAAAAATTSAPAEVEKEAVEAEEVNVNSLRLRFSALIDSDFDSARSLLEEFGIAQFSALTETDFAAFSNKLSELEGQGA